jgi:hypothetical protein
MFPLNRLGFTKQKSFTFWDTGLPQRAHLDAYTLLASGPTEYLPCTHQAHLSSQIFSAALVYFESVSA